ncbi:MAG: NADPH-dependent F420 reductase [Thermodesulfobacteriota bacterium]
MKIGIVGATGSFGKGLVYRWAKRHTVFVGSRIRERGEEEAKQYRLELKKWGVDANLVGTNNQEAIANGDVVVLAVHFEHLQALLTDLRDPLHHKIVISPIVAIKKGQSFQYQAPLEGSVALLIQKMLPTCAVVSALHTVPAPRLHKLDRIIEGDVPICSDHDEAKETVMGLVKEIEQLHPINAGPLEVSRMVEPIVPLILNIKQYGLKKNTCIKFI